MLLFVKLFFSDVIDCIGFFFFRVLMQVIAVATMCFCAGLMVSISGGSMASFLVELMFTIHQEPYLFPRYWCKIFCFYVIPFLYGRSCNVPHPLVFRIM